MSLNALQIIVADYPIEEDFERQIDQVERKSRWYLQCRELCQIGERVVGENTNAIIAEIQTC